MSVEKSLLAHREFHDMSIAEVPVPIFPALVRNSLPRSLLVRAANDGPGSLLGRLRLPLLGTRVFLSIFSTFVCLR